MAITYGSYDGYFDNIQLEKSQLSRGYNLIENSSFENGGVQWSPSDSYSSVIGDLNDYSGAYDAKISLSSVGTSYLQSLSKIPALPGQYYTLLGFINTDGISNGVGGGGARLHVYFYDINNNYINDYVSQNVGGTLGWTKYVLPFGAPANSATMKIRVEVANSLGTAYFDNIRLSYGKLAATATYDSNKNYALSTTDQLGRTVSQTPDAYGQTLTATSPGGETAKYTYDGQERLRTATDNGGNTSTYNLDANGNILNTSVALTNDNMSFGYDRNNNMTSATDADSNTTNMTYDQNGRITNQTNPTGSMVSSNYDNYGNLGQVSLSNGPTYNYNYDLEGNVTGSSVASGSSMQNGYDAVGNLTSQVEKDASNNTVTTVGAPSTGSMYSSLNQILGYNFTYSTFTSKPIPFSYSYNVAGLLSTATDAGKLFSFNYDESNNPITKVNPNSTTDNFTYNDAKQVTNIQTIDGSSNIKWSSNYTYDTDGEITQIAGSGPANSSATYTYNSGTEKKNRLTSASINGGQYVFNYSYDALGNILSMDVANGTGTPKHQTFTYDAANTIASPGFIYDNNGNLTNAVLNSITYQYGYDANNRLIKFTDITNNIVTTYTYDAEGNRITKTVNGVTTTYHYLNGEVLYETLSSDSSNIIHALYLRTPQGVLEGVSLNYDINSSTNAFYYYHYNAHGDVTVVTDSNGNVYRQYTYDPYGNIIIAHDGSGTAININSDAGFNNAYLYAGYRYDQESGLYFLNSRYYAPSLGQFISKDSQLSVGSIKSLNLYAYSNGDPVNLYDQDGNRPLEASDPQTENSAQRAASFATMSNTNNYNYKHPAATKLKAKLGVSYDYKSAIATTTVEVVHNAPIKAVVSAFGFTVPTSESMAQLSMFSEGFLGIGVLALFYSEYNNHSSFKSDEAGAMDIIDESVWGLGMASGSILLGLSAPVWIIALGGIGLGVGGYEIKKIIAKRFYN